MLCFKMVSSIFMAASDSKWPQEWSLEQVIASDRKWSQVTASDRFFQNQNPALIRALW